MLIELEPSPNRPTSLLLVDDNPDDLLLIEAMVKMFHFRVDFRAQKNLGAGSPSDVDVVLLDLNLVESRGLDTVSLARKRFPTSAIVLLTGSAHSELAMDCLRHGAQDYLVKGSFDEMDLEKAIRFADERNRQRLELQEHATALQLVLESQPVGFLVLDRSGFVERMNDRACSMLGWEEGTGVGRRVPISFDLERPCRVGLQVGDSKRTLEVRAARSRSSSNGNMDTFLVLDDVTDRVAREFEAAEQEKLETVGRVCFGVAHEFNNLLAIAQTKTEFLSGLIVDDPICRAHIDDLKYACDRGSRLVRQLMTFYGKPQGGERTVSLRPFLEGIGERLNLLGGPFHKIEVSCLGGGLEVKASKESLSKILSRLVANACEATPRGGLIKVLATDGASLSSCGRAREGYYCISIEDRGVGIREEDQPKIFEPFFTTKDTRAGRGLGLSVVSNLLREIGGWIEFDSAVDIGSKFRVFLPAREERATDEDRPEAVSGSWLGLEEEGQKPLVLVVDDEPIIRFSVERLLDHAGFRVEVAEDGLAAIAILEERGSDFSLLVTDLNMPGMHGKELVERATRMVPDLGILVMSGFGSAGAGGDWLAAKGAKFVAKPFTRDGLVAAAQESSQHSGSRL